MHSLWACKPCTAIPVCTSKVMYGQPQPHENKNLERIPFRLHLAQRNSYDKIIEEHSHAPSHKIRSFLLKTDQDTHRLNSWWQHRSSHQQAYHYDDVMYQNNNRGHWEEKHERSKRDKNSYTSYYRVHINTDAFIQHTTKSVVFFKKDYKICTIP